MSTPQSRVARALVLPALAGVAVVFAACTDSSAPAPVAIRVTIAADSILVGDTVRATATGSTARGESITAAVRWQSADTTIATVDSLGRVVARREGITRITATANGVSGDATLRVAQSDISVLFHDDVGQPPVFLIADTANIQAVESSKYEIASFVASARGRRANFVLESPRPYCGGCQLALLDLSGLPVGPIDVTITATDVRGTSRSVTRTFKHDNPPRIVVTAPVEFTATPGTIHVTAQCTDDSGTCPDFEVLNFGSTVNSPYFQTASGRIDTDITLSNSALLNFTAVDAAGQRRSVTRNVYVVSSPSLTEVATVPFGQVVDVQGAQVLFKAESVSLNVTLPPRTLWRSTSGAAPESLFTRDAIGAAYLTPHGAVAVTGSAVNSTAIEEWRDGSMLNLSSGYYPSGFMLAGTHGVWNDGSVSKGALYERDFSGGVTTLVTSDAVNTNNGVAANGDVAWATSGHDIRWLHGGSVLSLTADGASAFNNSPRTDGINVSYDKHPPLSVGPIVAWIGGQEQVITTGNGTLPMAGGWIAWPQAIAPSTTAHVWTRAPDGTVRQVDQFSNLSSIAALAQDGTVVLTANGHAYASAPPYAVMRDLGVTPPYMAFIVRGDQIFALVGRSAYIVTP